MTKPVLAAVREKIRLGITPSVPDFAALLRESGVPPEEAEQHVRAYQYAQLPRNKMSLPASQKKTSADAAHDFIESLRSFSLPSG